MTEQEFDRNIEEFAQRLEQYVEASAERLEERLTCAWNKSRLFRFLAGTASIASALCLFLLAKHLFAQGHKAAALWCFILGAAGLSAEIFTVTARRRNQKK